MRKILIAFMLMLPGCIWGQGDDYNYTNIHQDQGATSAIDWLRILEPYWPVSTATFKIGDVRLSGTITNTNGYPTVSEITKMVRDVMNDMRITDGMLANIEDETSPYKQLSETQWHDIALKALDITLRSGVNPYGGEYAVAADAVQALKQGLGTQEAEAVIQNGRKDVFDFLLGKGRDGILKIADSCAPELEGNVSQRFFGTVMLVVSAAQLGWDLGELTKTYHIFDREEWMHKMMQRQMLKELFYKTVSEKLAKMMDDRFKGGEWVLTVDTMVERNNARLFDIPITQNWCMKANLRKIDRGYNTRYGTYQGHMKLWVEHDLQQFDEQFRPGILLNKKLPFKVLLPLCKVVDIEYSATKLSDKVLESYDFQVPVVKGSLKKDSWPFTRYLKENVIDFNLNHSGEFRVNVALYDDGVLNYDGIHSNIKFKFDFQGKVNGRNLVLIAKSQENTNNWRIGRLSGDLTSTMHQFVNGENVKIMEDPLLFQPLTKEQGYEITDKGDPYKKLREGSPGYQPPVLPMMKSKSVNVGNEGIWVYDWKSSLSADIRETIERGDAIVANGQLPSEYAFLLPEGLDEDDLVLVNDTMFMLCAKIRDGLSFDGFVSRVKRNGFIGGFSVAGKQFAGGNGSKECFVLNNPDNGYVTIEIEDANEEMTEEAHEEMTEDASEEVTDIEVNVLSPRMNQLQKQMQAILEEMKKHPEKAKELGEKMAKISLEMQKESLKRKDEIMKSVKKIRK